MIENGYVYLTASYGEGVPPSEEEIDRSFWQASSMVAELMRSGLVVFAPIICLHSMRHFGVAKTAQWWDGYTATFLRDAEALYVLQNDGWQTSRKVKSDIKYARDNNIPVFHLKPDAAVLNKGLEAGGYT
jgi:hypothetical protein